MRQHSARQILTVRSLLSLTVLSVVLTVLLTGCGVYRRSADQIQSVNYQIGDGTPLPFYTLYQRHNDSLTIHFKIPQRALHVATPDGRDAGYALHVRVTTPGGSTTIHDSATYFIVPDSLQRASGLLAGTIGIATGDAPGKRLSLVLTDLNSQALHEFRTILPAAWPPASTHYYTESVNGYPLFPEFIHVDDTFIIHSSIITDQLVRVRYYADDFPVAFPPFANLLPQHFDYAADSIFQIRFADGVSDPVRFYRPGIYHLTADTNSRQGFTLLVRADPYPWISRPEQMVAPLVYLTTTKEFQDLRTASDPKEAVDAFWLAQTGNELRASRMIREYYRRVEKANYLFTSYQDGWKTDRGMIYMIYGPPGVVQQTEDSEVWTYGESKHLFSLTFVFVKMENPFTDNDYVLNRNLNYKTGWHQMINSWRR